MMIKGMPTLKDFFLALQRLLWLAFDVSIKSSRTKLIESKDNDGMP